MSFDKVEHELHKRRSGRNIGLGLVLIGFIAIVFGLTVVKVTRGGLAPSAAPTSAQVEAEG